MTEAAAGAPIVASTPQEIRELKSYVRLLETQLHERGREVADLRAARSAKLARALRHVSKSPRQALRDLVSVFRVPAEVPFGKLAHRHFPLFTRAPTQRTAAPEKKSSTLLPEILDHCAAPTVVILAGGMPRTLAADTAPLVVTPHDFEVRLGASVRPHLLVDTDVIAPSSPWHGVMGFDDMRVNQSFMRMLELIRQRDGRTFVASPSEPHRFPLLADFSAEVQVVDDLRSVDLVGAEGQA